MVAEKELTYEQKLQEVLKYFLDLNDKTDIFLFMHRHDNQVHWGKIKMLREILKELES